MILSSLVPCSQAYPHLLISAGLHDPRVPYWEPAKWAAKLRTCNTSGSLVLFNCNLGGGHFVEAGRFDALGQTAQVRCWIGLLLHV